MRRSKPRSPRRAGAWPAHRRGSGSCGGIGVKKYGSWPLWTGPPPNFPVGGWNFRSVKCRVTPRDGRGAEPDRHRRGVRPADHYEAKPTPPGGSSRRPALVVDARAHRHPALRAAGGLWREVGARLGCTENAARSFGVDRLGLPMMPRVRQPEPEQTIARDPLPPGHPLTWGLFAGAHPLARRHRRGRIHRPAADRCHVRVAGGRSALSREYEFPPLGAGGRAVTAAQAAGG